MILYEYVCKSCGHINEVWRRPNDSSPVICEMCGKEKTRIISAPLPPVFKGKGFHSTDYKDKK